jgi:hypothetical protein
MDGCSYSTKQVVVPAGTAVTVDGETGAQVKTKTVRVIREVRFLFLQIAKSAACVQLEMGKDWRALWSKRSATAYLISLLVPVLLPSPQPSAEDSGLSLRCINELFALIHSRQSAAAAHPSSNGGDDASHVRFVVKCSFIQIYQESVFDLLSDSQPQYVSVSLYFLCFLFSFVFAAPRDSFVMQLQGAGCE